MADEVGRLYILFDADGRPYVKGLRDLDRQTDAAGRRMESTWGKYGKAAGMAAAAGLAVIGTAAIGIGVATVKAAATFEYEMSRIKANANGTAAEMKALQDTVIQLGKDTVFSAGETAQAANELVKAGLTIGQTMEALPGMLALASAGELDVAKAAELAANSLTMFNLKAGDTGQVADTLALAANRSTTEVDLLGLSLQMSGTVAAQAGLTIQETAAALALMANNGLKGSDAGTSLKQMFMQLMGPSQKARDLMQQYGISAYDATGKMLGMDQIIQNVSGGLEGLTDEERDFALATIFGSDAVRAANILLKEGAGRFREMTAEVSQAGAAQEIAATKMDNLMGSWEQLKGSLETLAIQLGTKALPAIREFVDGLTETVNEALETGDWSKLGEDIGAMVADGIETATPYIVEALWTATKAGVKGLLAGAMNDALNMSTGSDFTKMRDYLAERMAGVYRDLPRTQAFQAALQDLQSNWFTGAFTKGKDFNVPKAQTKEDVLALAAALGMTLTPEGWAQVQQFNEAMIRGTTMPGSLWTPGSDPGAAFRGMGEGASDAADGLGEFGDAASDAGDAGGELNKIIADLAAAFDSGISPADAWAAAVERSAEAADTSVEKFDASKTSLKTWAEELQAQIQAAVDFERNVLSLMDTFGDDYDPTKLFEALSTLEPVQVEALVDGTPEEAKAVIDGLYAAMAMASEEHKEGFAREALNMGEEAGGAAADTAKAWQGAFETAMRGWRFTVSFDVNGNVRIAPISARVGSSSTVRAGSGSGSRQVPLFDDGGVLPPGLHTILNASGMDETIVTAAQESALVGEIEALIAQLKTNLGDGESLADKLTKAFSERSGLAESYISREAARYGMYEAEDAPMELLEQTLLSKIGFIGKAVSEAQAQLDAAKAQGLPAEQINDLAEALYNLKSDAADARKELAELARVPLENAIEGWQGALGNMGSWESLLGQHSGASAMLDALGASQSIAYQGAMDSSLGLMRQATTPAEIARYGQDAMDAVLDMFSTGQASIERHLADQLRDVETQQSDWERAWQARSDTLRETNAEQSRILDEQTQAINDAYTEQIALIDAREQALRESWSQADTRDQIADLERELAAIYSRGGKTASDIDRISAIDEQLADIREQAERQAQLDELARERDVAQGARDKALADIEARKKELDEQYTLETEALERDKAAKDTYYADLKAKAEKAAQDEKDILITKYAGMLATVQEAQADLMAEGAAYYAAGKMVISEFVHGLYDSIPHLEDVMEEIGDVVADYLELHSPAKLGPLSTLDTWWDAFLPTLVAPIRQSDIAGDAANIAGAARTSVERRESRVDVYVHAEPGLVDPVELARVVGEQIIWERDNARASYRTVR